MASKLLNELYKDPSFGLLGKTKFKAKVRKLHPEISNKQIDQFLERQELQQVNKKKPFKGYYKIVADPYTYQCDIFYLKQYKTTNNNKDTFMIFSEILSKKMFIYPIKSNSKANIIACLEEFIEDNKVVGIGGDNEFNINDIKNLLSSKNIKYSFDVAKDDHFSKGNKLGIVDSAVKQVKRLIRNYMLLKKTTRYIDVLDELVMNYNTTPHSSIGNKTPNDLYNDEDAMKRLQEKLEDHNKKLNSTINLETGDLVRVALNKGKFDKENITFSKEIYLINEVDGYKYRVMTTEGVEIPRKYKYFELLKVDEDKVDNKINDSSIELSKKKQKQKRKLRKEFGEDIKVGESNRKKVIARKAQVNNVNDKLDLFED